MAAALCTASLPLAVQADSSNVVTLGANLTQEQKTSMYEYFGTSADQVETIEVTNADERKYMEGIASEEQIGTRTYSCSYVEPTSDGGIQVKVCASELSAVRETSGVHGQSSALRGERAVVSGESESVPAEVRCFLVSEVRGE